MDIVPAAKRSMITTAFATIYTVHYTSYISREEVIYSYTSTEFKLKLFSLHFPSFVLNGRFLFQLTSYQIF